VAYLYGGKMKKLFHMTKDGIEELEIELKTLKLKRTDIAEAIKNAREQGDLSENAEYHVAKDEHEKTESRILEIEHILQNVEIIKKPKATGAVKLGSSVELKDNKGNKKQFQLVGTVEADPLNGKISDASPIGQALLGQKVGAEVAIGPTKFVVDKIN